MSTSGVLCVEDGGYGNHYVQVYQDGYVDLFGVEVLNYLNKTLDEGYRFIESIYPFALDCGATLTQDSNPGDWEYLIDMTKGIFRVKGYTNHYGKAHQTEWSLDTPPTAEQMIAAFDDEPELEDGQEW